MPTGPPDADAPQKTMKHTATPLNRPSHRRPHLLVPHALGLAVLSVLAPDATADVASQWDPLQLVGRYSYANSAGPDGVVAQPRYEARVDDNAARGDAYHSLYAGAQYFIYGDKLKLMAGAEWARLAHDGGESYDGFTLLTGIRLSF